MTLGLLVVSGKSVTHTATHKKACGGRCVCCGMAQFGEWSLTVWSSVVFCLSLFFHQPDRRGKREKEKAELVGRYLVDPASSHMLVLKIKPCMP